MLTEMDGQPGALMPRGYAVPNRPGVDDSDRG